MSAPWETNEYWYQEQELRKNKVGGSVFWIILGVLAMFKIVRRIFFWGSLAILGFAVFVMTAAQTMPQKGKTLYYIATDPKNSLSYDGVFLIALFFGMFFFALWIITAIMALIGRTAKKHLED